MTWSESSSVNFPETINGYSRVFLGRAWGRDRDQGRAWGRDQDRGAWNRDQDRGPPGGFNREDDRERPAWGRDRDGGDRGPGPRDGPPRDGPPGDGPPRDGPPRDGPPPRGEHRWKLLPFTSVLSLILEVGGKEVAGTRERADVVITPTP